ncbi:hypothetical protein LPJ59_004209 [Coemansia sp. RSA 2399]|nr:hypothetical protein LPJ59_004209 [Coemansia sp. RSA 2399]KAJ1900517.1 hypothetical protein LPJ81_003928 [Coemansia sp. IMI 209127]
MNDKEDHNDDAQSQDLDDKMLRVLDNVAEYRRLRDQCNTSFRHAFFALACAKRSAGYQWISPDLYNAHPTAIATVSIADSSGAGGLEIAGVHRRQPGASGRDDATAAAEEEGEADDDEKKPQRRKASDDPLLWFGMLVPPTLKDAQNAFVASLDSLVRLAQLEWAIRSEQDELQNEIPGW